MSVDSNDYSLDNIDDVFFNIINYAFHFRVNIFDFVN